MTWACRFTWLTGSPPSIADGSRRLASREWLLVGMLILLTLAAFSPVWDCDFVNYDDPEYVLRSWDVHCGLSGEGLRRAFTSITSANWHPLTILSLQIDYQLFGLNPLGYHLHNLLLHTANTCLLFVALFHMTGRPWRSALTAALFAVHPLHVESVAWVSERKDVLSTLFWMLALWAHAAHAARPQVGRYFLVLIPTTLGLLAKPMLVTLPCVLLLLDWWPLRRLEGLSGRPAWNRLGYLVLEKTPLLALSALASVITLHAQHRGGAVVDLEQLSLGERLANTVLTYRTYLEQMAWPWDLAAFYPYPSLSCADLSIWASLGLLVVLSVLFIALGRKAGYLAVGWLWYLGTLVPVIGLVQVGSQSHADRYTYIPLVGLFVMFSWGLGELACHWRLLRAAGVLSVLLLSWYMLLSWGQVHYWQNGILLWQHALDVTGPNKVACTSLGGALLAQGETDAAAPLLRQALNINPSYEMAQHLLGVALLRQGKLEEAVCYLRQAARSRPDRAEYHNHLGLALLKQGEIEASRVELTETLRLDPQYAAAHYNLGVGYAQQHRWRVAAYHFRQAVELQPDQSAYRRELADAIAHQR